MSESGNDYFQARYYNSSVGRFLSPDWSAKVEPIPYSKVANPQSLNLYSYVQNNPLGEIDPDGHASQTGKGSLISCQEEAGSGGCNTSATTFQQADAITAAIRIVQTVLPYIFGVGTSSTSGATGSSNKQSGLIPVNIYLTNHRKAPIMEVCGERARGLRNPTRLRSEMGAHVNRIFR